MMGSLKAETWELAAAKKRESLVASFPSEWLVPEDLLPPASQADVTTWPKTSGWFTDASPTCSGSPPPYARSFSRDVPDSPPGCFLQSGYGLRGVQA